jgi:hypothetical protein
MPADWTDLPKGKYAGEATDSNNGATADCRGGGACCGAH